MHRIIAAAGTALLVLMGADLAAEPRDLSGEYVMEGRGDAQDDTAYAGTCILKRAGKGYEVSCLNASTNHIYVGKGLALGNMLAIMIGDQLNGNHGAIYEGEYLVIYDIGADGRLVGRWVDAISGSQGNETLTPKR